MKLGIVALAIFMVIHSVNSDGSLPTANSLYIDVQIKICLSMTDFWKTGLSARETFYATWASDNKTVAELAKKCNDSIVSAIIKIIGPMTEVVIADIILEIGAVLDAVNGIQSCIISLAQNFADVDTSTYYSIGNTLHVLGKSIKDAFVTMLASVATSVTDATFNVAAKIADCEKTNFALYDAIWKQVNTDVTACLKSYATDDKYVIENLTALFKTVCAVGLTPLNNVTLCIKSNGLTDSKSIMAASNCTVGALVTCFENGNAEAIAFYKSFSTSVIAAIQPYYDAKRNNIVACLTNIYTSAAATIATFATPLIACVNIPAP